MHDVMLIVTHSLTIAYKIYLTEKLTGEEIWLYDWIRNDNN